MTEDVVEFWSSVTFRPSDDEERLALEEVMRKAAGVAPSLVESVYKDGVIVVLPPQSRALAELIQRLNLDGDGLEAIRRGLIKALAFNQHYVHNAHGWEPADVAIRHNRS